MAKEKGVLMLRRREDGTVEIQGNPPERHTFSARQLVREPDAFEVVVRFAGEEYRLLGFESIPNEETGEPAYNFTAWQCERVKGGKG